jgi:hypothetical protein
MCSLPEISGLLAAKFYFSKIALHVRICIGGSGDKHSGFSLETDQILLWLHRYETEAFLPKLLTSSSRNFQTIRLFDSIPCKHEIIRAVFF